MADGFLGRWARRKQEVRAGRPLEEPAPPLAAPEPPPAAPAAAQPALVSPPEQPAAAPPPPTLEDVRALTPQSDFQRFMAPDVDPAVRNAAMKKLFAEPHFNVMDGLDVYIDDYNKPDPMPASMLRKLASAQFLKLFDEEEKKDDSVPSPAGAVPPAAPAAPSAPALAVPPGPTELDHDHTDLRLQQDHAAGPQGPGRGPQ